jgi:hypothetical protein
MTPDNSEAAFSEKPLGTPQPATAPLLSSASPRRLLTSAKLSVAILAVVAVVGGAYWMLGRQEPPAPARQQDLFEGTFPPDPRLSYTGPFQNIHPDVKYVGDARCNSCHIHKAIFETYSQHPMGRSITPIAQFAARQAYDNTHHNPFEYFDVQFLVERSGDRVYHRQKRLDAAGKPIYDFAHEVHYAIGSGTRGHSYLTSRDGYLFQTPISWYTQKERWNLSPGFSPQMLSGRQVPPACLFCHANHAEHIPGTRNRYREPVFQGLAIGCERCHGPGERHIKSGEPYDIVNPRRLEPALREAVCQQCHLEGQARVVHRGRQLYDYRPGMPFEAFYSVFVASRGAGGERKAVNHVEQMYSSRCFQRSRATKKMGCISCHNPHESVPEDRRVTYYRDRCLKCHKGSGCRVPEPVRLKKNPADSCIACHMPTYANVDVAHTASTDHRIVREAGKEPPVHPVGGGHGGEEVPVEFYGGHPDRDPEIARDLGIALLTVAYQRQVIELSSAELVLRLLGPALKECPGDLAAWEAKGKALMLLKRSTEACRAYEALLKRAPNHEGALVALGTLNHDLGHPEDALRYWRRAVDINPWMPEYRKNLFRLLAHHEQWDEAGQQTLKWIELDPADVDARKFRIVCLIKTGRKDQARAEFARIQALRPANLAQLNAWFEEEMLGN